MSHPISEISVPHALETNAKSTYAVPPVTDAAALIAGYHSNPPKWVIEDLLSEDEIAGLHGPQEVFKTIFCLQLQESLASGRAFLGKFVVPCPRRTLLMETEMSPRVMGKRLAAMYPGVSPPDGMLFASEAQLRQFRRAAGLRNKFTLVKKWVQQYRADALILDTCNPFFRGKESASAEENVGAFFDLLEAVPAPVKIFVRHNHKRRDSRPSLMESPDDATLIRGSGQFADVPDLLMQLKRQDRRTQEARLTVSKFRHGTRPDDLSLWFDSLAFRLTPLNPVSYLLKILNRMLTRQELLDALDKRFGIAQRKADDLIKSAPVVERMAGHEKCYEISHDAGTELRQNRARG